MTPAQEQMLHEAVGDGTDWPKHTSDPEVNYEIDRRQNEDDSDDPDYAPMPSWAEASEEVRQGYIDEVEGWPEEVE
jgi:hypothetical protein